MNLKKMNQLQRNQITATLNRHSTITLPSTSSQSSGTHGSYNPHPADDDALANVFGSGADTENDSDEIAGCCIFQPGELNLGGVMGYMIEKTVDLLIISDELKSVELYPSGFHREDVFELGLQDYNDEVHGN
ncbi:hypothetical protein BGZ95_008686 [Linnemannia exigua]|uniref:Uncharacterized protein n=1 Tax=Linnemannia exigua TaxID=604196 RepID=A0AAD4DKU3_9FUNG|nr:hypothetical protein BGZ95_008686 [Linnemannia exigua]